MNKKEEYSWSNPPYDEEEMTNLCKKSVPSDFIAAVGRDRYGKTYIAVAPKIYFGKYCEVWYQLLDVEHLIPFPVIRFVGGSESYNNEANIFLLEAPCDEVAAKIKSLGFAQNEEYSKLIELKFFKKNLPRDTNMEMEEFFELMKNTTANLKKMRAGMEYMRWQFGNPFEYEEFISEMKDTTEGWVSSHC